MTDIPQWLVDMVAKCNAPDDWTSRSHVMVNRAIDDGIDDYVGADDYVLDLMGLMVDRITELQLGDEVPDD